MVREIVLKDKIVHEISLENAYLKFSCLDYGATITKLASKDKNGEFTNNVLTYKDYNDYLTDKLFVGKVIAPFPGRIKGKIQGIELDLETNNGDNTLHGANFNFAYTTFAYETSENQVILKGSLTTNTQIDLTITYTLEANSLKINYQASALADTIFSVTNHSYFNLGGDLLEHELFIDSNYYLTLDSEGVGSSHMADVHGTGHDFQTLTPIKQITTLPIDLYEKTQGLDHAYLLFDGENAIKLVSKASGKVLTLSTDEESVVVYTGNHFSDEEFENFKGHKHAAIAFEPQAIPNGMNTKISDGWYLKKGIKESTTTLTFDLLDA